MKFDNKIALVTGSAQGIGFSIAEKLASEGATVIIADIAEDAAKSASEKLKSAGAKSDYTAMDVSDFNQVAEKMKALVEKHERIDILVNNAGITRDGLILRMSEKDWDMVLDINLKSVFNCSKALARSMMKTGGVIVNVASIIGQMGNAGQANYAASKGGIIALTKTLAKEFASRGVRANAVAPGFISTAMTDKLSEEVKGKMLEAIPLKRLGRPEDVANLVSFLCSDESAYITGQVVRIDGGMVM
ncbi:MAG: 3-oxoacyl-[acyl-carrier-protein] reductase [Elusimicrobia bacterium CG03_land_8_20_14_0_80_50_18]|nr:MAG: 3-oxoacyl-[acyl-carrier-protein] reductase [Elusimicrobia bacterium CG03_land_8_20_14_0_80_50_18]PIX14810.1 MAG: 3-oxoacyl-[acyl-carrier-protein] reductase [Elusimicrobia bacterium CG_4_8_14_3_um_filter_50_9]